MSTDQEQRQREKINDFIFKLMLFKCLAESLTKSFYPLLLDSVFTVKNSLYINI